MNIKFINSLKNISYTLSANIISIIVTMFVTLILPKFIGVNEYGYWQLYIFYISYAGFLHFGWNDGLYLRYGGENYNDLNKRLFFSQFIMIVFFQFIIGIIIWGGSDYIVEDINKKFIIRTFAIAVILNNTRLMLLNILQATNRIQEYAKVTLADRLIYIFTVLAFLFSGIRNYKLIVMADLVGKIFSLVYSIYFCKEIALGSLRKIQFSIKEAILNIRVGIKLMIANVASMVIIGIVRLGIENNWNVTTFGKVSLALSISNMMMTVINAVGIIMFPMLRRTNKNNFSNIYVTVRQLFIVSLFGSLLVYFPIKIALSLWLPQYVDSFKYMVLVFPVFTYEGKIALLIGTYLKALRKEKIILYINLISVVFSLCLTYISIYIFDNLYLSILNILIAVSFKTIIAEIYLANLLDIKIIKDIIIEICLTFLFILIGWYINSNYNILIYGSIYLIYLIVKRKEITTAYCSLKLLIEK